MPQEGKTVLVSDSIQLTWTGDTVKQSKEHFEKLLNPVITSSMKEADSEDSGESLPLSLA